MLGWTAPAFDSMAQNGSTPQLGDSADDKSAKTWIGSSMTLGALVGALISGKPVYLLTNWFSRAFYLSSGPMAQFFGRKRALILYGIPFTLGWLLIAFAKSVTLVIVGRVVAGLSAGLLSGTAPSYVVEISIVSIRGLLGACFQVD